MTDQLIETANLETVLADFARRRNWERFHSPKNLTMALTGEVGELAEIFQWMTEEESRQVMNSSETAAAAEDELADVMIYIVRLASVLGVDLNRAVTSKLAKNELRFPPLT